MKKYLKPNVRCAELVSCTAMLSESDTSLGLGGSNSDSGAPDVAESNGLYGRWDEDWDEE